MLRGLQTNSHASLLWLPARIGVDPLLAQRLGPQAGCGQQPGHVFPGEGTEGPGALLPNCTGTGRRNNLEREVRRLTGIPRREPHTATSGTLVPCYAKYVSGPWGSWPDYFEPL